MGGGMSAFRAVSEELARARAANPPFNSGHEGYAVLLEEVDELKREVFWGKKRAASGQPSDVGRSIHVARMRAEAVQVAAMAIRFIEDVCDAP